MSMYMKKIKLAKALILPSYTESFPNGVLETMACICHVISIDVGAISNMLSIVNRDSFCGIRIKPRSE